MTKKGKEKKVNSEKDYHCVKCSKLIDYKTEKYTELATHNMEDGTSRHSYFHFDCWKVYFEEYADIKMKKMLISQLADLSNLFSAINRFPSPTVSKDEVIDKIKNGRRKDTTAKRQHSHKETD